MTRSTYDSAQLLSFVQDHPLPVLAHWAIAFAVLITVWDRRLKSRRALARLDDQALYDIGVTPDDAAAEAAKPFWQP